MKKVILSMAALAMIFATSCSNDSKETMNNDQQAKVDMSDFYLYTDADIDEQSRVASGQKSCHSMVNLNRLLNENPGLEQTMYDIEYNLRAAIAAKKPDGAGNGNGGGNNGGGGTDPDPGFTDPVSIPVVVNIIEQYSNQVTTQQINSQIAVLNEDFNNNNSNTSGVPSEFSGDVADCGISFTLHAVNRVVSTQSSWGTNDAMKHSSQGGIDVTDPSTYLNIWVCEIGGGILGYAQFPGGPSSTDGVVIGTDFFGENAAGGVYGHGRTATHEVGHWLNLRHIWGDGQCKQDDFVQDTPPSNGPNYGCPSYPTVNCQTADMTMNYMDYVYDDCMYMFTNGQNTRMRALFESGGARASLAGN
ncbi:zinc metalloprotease [Mangrovimonas futianensis]|uniref:zinc metalloprotease n=1 Tax=Mangrovimonas futianensis TaxID=2895523 RepID=UPI001E44640C|nr:zinc metalloprotease [Mangrovimonas futianensis]MCF1420646.1 zinc metalloprotease [Mangrovimonas futianensis]